MKINEASALLGQLDRELWVVTAARGEQHGGLISTTVQSISIVPELPRVLVGIAKRHFTWELVEASGGFALNLLGEEQRDWVWRFGLASGRSQDKLAGLAWEPGRWGSPLLKDGLGWLDCTIEAKLDTGDRTVYLAEAHAAGQLCIEAPLTMKRLLQLAPPDRLKELKEQLMEDAAGDAVDIRMFRARAKP